MSTEKKVIIVSSDNQKFPVERKVAEKSTLLRNLLKDLAPSDQQQEPTSDDEDEDDLMEIPTPNVRADVLKHIFKWCEHYKDVPNTDDDNDDAKNSAPIDEWDKQFLNVDQEMLYEIILAANYLNIRPLLTSGCKRVAEMIRGKSPDEIRKTFNIVNDFSPEEEAAIRRENEWAEDR